ncbi:hypothetical protein DAPK24_046140 [Pichia kluyveri]|uniref:Uncharacterized protein n=1 Tax=Pichia kluyveri TaxID=36015 RepID=A0AAV5R904_PICKL|nr:hypothetical protein DAPK24_046140 [Pichia kluyveri]
MSTLSKKTKGQLVEIAEDLNIDITDCKVKKEIYEVVHAYFVNNADKFDENSKYYEIASLAKLGSPKKTVYIDIEETENKNNDDDDDETEEAEDDDSDEKVENEEDDDDDDDDTYEYDDDDDDFDYENYTNIVKAFKTNNLSEYFELKNYEIRDYLGDPYTLNELAYYIETTYLFYSLISLTPLDSYLPSKALEYLPTTISKIPVLSSEIFSTASVSTFLLWGLISKALPLVFSYYVNFTYDFDRDAFTESLAKLFLAILVFKTDIDLANLKDEIKYVFSIGDIKFVTFKHFFLIAVFNLRNVFGNWILLDALFTSILSLYANLAFV